MNLVEGLSREIHRVLLIKQEAEKMAGDPGVNMAFYIAGCECLIKEGYDALGNGDIAQMKTACQNLAEIN